MTYYNKKPAPHSESANTTQKSKVGFHQIDLVAWVLYSGVETTVDQTVRVKRTAQHCSASFLLACIASTLKDRHRVPI